MLAGGDCPEGFSVGHYLAPTVLGDVNETMDVYRKGTFGPIISIVPVTDETRLLEMANACEEGGLIAYIFTQNLTRAEYFAAYLRCGEIQINSVKYDTDLPHGGIGQSGIGPDCSSLALNDFLLKSGLRAPLIKPRLES